MRKSKLFLLCLLATSLAFGFQSCKKDKDDSLLPELEIKTCALSPEETDLVLNSELKLNLETNNSCAITVRVNDNAIEAKDGVYILPTDKFGEYAVLVEFNDGQNDVQAKKLDYKVTKQPIEIEEITVNGVTFKMNKVYGGTFLMGAQNNDPDGPNYDSYANTWNENPVHEVTLSSYSISQTEVTQALWKAVMGELPNLKYNVWKEVEICDDKPVMYAMWDDIQTFLEKLNDITGRTFRLTTDAEWEFAARGGINSKGYRYSGSNDIDEVAWTTSNSGGKGTAKVASLAPNELGIYDMSGNAYELCQDWFAEYTGDSQTNPTGPETGIIKVFRGGGYDKDSSWCRVSIRILGSPNSLGGGNSFRLALDSK